MEIERVSKKEDLIAIHLLQKEIYQLDAEESLAYHTLVTFFYSGGVILKVTSNLKIIGFSIAILGIDDNIRYLHSYMTGVLKSYQNRGVAQEISKKKSEIAKAMGINFIKWSFNPYSVKLANLYFNKYGAQIENKYIENMYLKKEGNTLNADRVIAFLNLNGSKNKRKYTCMINAELLKLTSYIDIEPNLISSSDPSLNSSRVKLCLPLESRKSDKRIIKTYRNVLSKLLKSHAVVKFESYGSYGIYYFYKIPTE
ncbi:MAG: putative GNAT superfamily acetyltransferase [Psychroserpens sp.]|jgi:predicted GNAT superfamily acetyltransferase